MRKWFLLVLLLTGFGSVFAFNGGSDSLLIELLHTIDNRSIYVNQRLERIKTLQRKLTDAKAKPNADLFNVYNALFLENRKFIYDSAFKYATRLIDVAHREKDPVRIGLARSQLGFVLISSGFFKEAFDTLHRVEPRVLPDSARVEYYTLMARGCYDLGDFNNDTFYKSYYFNLGHRYIDSARMFCPPGSYRDLYLSRIKNLKTRNYEGGLKDSRAILDLFSLPYEEQAINFYDLSHSYAMIGDKEKAREHLIRSALADLRAATKETAAMHALARMMYDEGRIEYAYRFIQQAREDALFYGARQRQFEISAIEPLISSAKLNSVDAQRRNLLLLSAALVVLVVVVIAFAVIIFKQLRRLKAAELAVKNANDDLRVSNHELREANRIKEEYIGYYFNINADYLNKIEAFKKAVDQKLINRRYDELRFIVDNINLKRERENLSYSFDKVFLRLFPDFIQQYNSMFKPEDRVQVKDEPVLNTEMRIFALIRMGIDDPEKIAKILGYSVNTIYAYKTRVKSKSIVPNDHFEEMIKEIKTA